MTISLVTRSSTILVAWRWRFSIWSNVTYLQLSVLCLWRHPENKIFNFQGPTNLWKRLQSKCQVSYNRIISITKTFHQAIGHVCCTCNNVITGEVFVVDDRLYCQPDFEVTITLAWEILYLLSFIRQGSQKKNVQILGHWPK